MQSKPIKFRHVFRNFTDFLISYCKGMISSFIFIFNLCLPGIYIVKNVVTPVLVIFSYLQWICLLTLDNHSELICGNYKKKGWNPLFMRTLLTISGMQIQISISTYSNLLHTKENYFFSSPSAKVTNAVTSVLSSFITVVMVFLQFWIKFYGSVLSETNDWMKKKRVIALWRPVITRLMFGWKIPFSHIMWRNYY